MLFCSYFFQETENTHDGTCLKYMGLNIHVHVFRHAPKPGNFFSSPNPGPSLRLCVGLYKGREGYS